MPAPPHRTPVADAPRARLRTSSLAHGGEAVGRLDDGRACFVPYAAPGEHVEVALVEEHPRWARAQLLDVVEPSPVRVPPPCPYYGPERCGGCRLQHVAPRAQVAGKRQAVADTLERIGGVAAPPVAEAVVPATFGYRMWARFAARRDGSLGFRRAGSNEVIPIDRCLLLATEAQALRNRAGDAWRGAEEVVLRAGPDGATALVRPRGREPVHAPAAVAAITVLLRDARGGAGPAPVRVRVDGLDLQVSAGSFFQPGMAGAEALSRLVRAAAEVGPGDRLLDLYAGVGLFAAGAMNDGAEVIAVEGDGSAVVDARANLPGATVVHGPVERHLAAAQQADVVVLDPPRSGAGRAVVEAVAGVARRRIVYVACDPAALARDVRTFAAHGWALRSAVPVDQFAQTAQVEVVAVLERGAREE